MFFKPSYHKREVGSNTIKKTVQNATLTGQINMLTVSRKVQAKWD